MKYLLTILFLFLAVWPVSAAERVGAIILNPTAISDPIVAALIGDTIITNITVQSDTDVMVRNQDTRVVLQNQDTRVTLLNQDTDVTLTDTSMEVYQAGIWMVITDTHPRGDTISIINVQRDTVISFLCNHVSVTNVSIQDTVEWFIINTDSDIWFKFMTSMTPDSGLQSGAFPIAAVDPPLYVERRMNAGSAVSAVTAVLGNKANVYILCGKR